MPVSLARKIRRIGLMPSTPNAEGKTIRKYDPSITPERRATIAEELRTEAKARRVTAFAQLQAPAKPHRRSKDRAKASNSQPTAPKSAPAKGKK
jgi:ribosome recycling factor